jgi:phosphopantothenoylcysteine decarboxylase/phosphopantothenate--cysteine ligase
MIAPGMHESLMLHPAVAGNIARLRSMGVTFAESRMEESKAKIASKNELVDLVLLTLSEKRLQEKRIIITAGPTIEFIDPVRTLSNRSSGRMGVALAREARRLGGSVTLIYGPGTAPPPPGIDLIRVVTTEDMLHASREALSRNPEADFFIAAAAVADFKPTGSRNEKISTRLSSVLTIELKPTPKIVEEVKHLSPGSFLVAFKAEYGGTEEEMRDASLSLMKRTGADLVVANDVSRPGAGFAAETNEVTLFNPDGTALTVPSASKDEIAKTIWNFILGG